MKKYIVVMSIIISAGIMTSCSNSSKVKREDKTITQVEQAEKPNTTEEPLEEDKTLEEAQQEDVTSETNREIGIYPDMQVPDFTLLDRDNNEVSLSDYKGKIVFLNFWATTCKYCIEEMPDLERFYNAHKEEDDFAFIGINMTKTWERKSKDKLIEWLDSENLTFPVVFDEQGNVAEEWMAHSLPVTFIITEEGISLGAIMGRTDFETLENILGQVRDM